jgi:hypothetical protein
MSGTMALLIFAAWIGMALILVAALAFQYRSRDPEEREKEDEAQWRWIMETSFIRNLDRVAKQIGSDKAWIVAMAANQQKTRNVTKWSEAELRDASLGLLCILGQVKKGKANNVDND